MLAVLFVSSILLAIVAWSGAAPEALAPLADWPTLVISQVLVLDLLGLSVLWYRLRHRDPLREAIKALRPTLLSTERIAGLAIACFVIRWLMLQAVAWKSSIPALHPFAFDRQLVSLSIALFGRPVWELFAPIAESRFWLGLLDFAYYAWFPVFVAVMLVVAWAPYSRERRRFLLAVVLLWVTGSWLGVLLSSAGPVYYSAVTGLQSSFDRQAALIAVNAPLAASVQTRLWAEYLAGPSSVVAGIAAFPSLHVGVPGLLSFAAPPGLRWWAVWLTAITWLSSILLGWHYWADGAGGILLAGVCWWCAGHTEAMGS